MELRKEASIEEIYAAQSLEGFAMRWLPVEGALTYRADPFGLWHEGFLFVFVEQFDYRDAHGVIDVIVLDRALRLVKTATVLREAWHLSYPFVFRWDGNIWMLPEASASGALHLYRAIDFPWDWQRVRTFALDAPAIDATPIEHEGKWWLFYSPAGTARDRLSKLHLAWADTPLGPWKPHPANPVYEDELGARPGGTPFRHNSKVVVPLQSCVLSYGTSLRFLSLANLSERGTCGARMGDLTAPVGAYPFIDGLHTLSEASGVTLLDLKVRKFNLAELNARFLRQIPKIGSLSALHT